MSDAVREVSSAPTAAHLPPHRCYITSKNGGDRLREPPPAHVAAAISDTVEILFFFFLTFSAGRGMGLCNTEDA